MKVSIIFYKKIFSLNAFLLKRGVFIGYAIIAYMSTLYNAKEAGARLRISESTVYRLLRAHKLHGLKIGRALRFTEEEILLFIERHREQGEPEKQKIQTLQTPKISFT
jgi:excisionase family DNA binding protein